MIKIACHMQRPETAESRSARGRFGLDTPLPADRRMVERAILRHLAEQRPGIVALALTGQSDTGPKRGGSVSISAGVPDLLLLAGGGRCVFVKIRMQAEDLSRAHHAFADLCRERAIALVVVRSLPEARQAFDRLSL